jgi:predicted secreted protein
MGRFVYRFEDQSRPLGKNDGAAETVKFLGQLLLATLMVAFLCGLSWMMATGDSRFFMRIVSPYF